MILLSFLCKAPCYYKRKWKKQDRTPTIMFNGIISKQLTKRKTSKIAYTESLPNYFQSVTKKVFCFNLINISIFIFNLFAY